MLQSAEAGQLRSVDGFTERFLASDFIHASGAGGNTEGLPAASHLCREHTDTC